MKNRFEAIIWPHFAAAYSFARWMVHDHHDAEDIVQESFVKALHASDTFHGSNVRPWLFAIVRNSALNLLTRQKRKEPLDEIPEPIDPSPSPELSLVQRRRRDLVRDAIARLPLDFREPLLLREMEGMSYKEIAFVLKLPLGTVMSRLSRARRLLIEELLPAKETGI